MTKLRMQIDISAFNLTHVDVGMQILPPAVRDEYDEDRGEEGIGQPAAPSAQLRMTLMELHALIATLRRPDSLVELTSMTPPTKYAVRNMPLQDAPIWHQTTKAYAQAGLDEKPQGPPPAPGRKVSTGSEN